MLLVIVLFLLAVGLLMLYSTSSYTASLKYNDGGYYLKKQAISTAVGLVAMIITALFPYKLYRKFSAPIYVLSVMSLFLVLTKLGYSANNATRWIHIAGLSIQPAEIVKIGLIVGMAAIFTKMTEKELRGWKPILFMIVIAGLPAGVLWKVTDNASSAIIVLGIAYAMLVVSTKKSIKPYILLAVGMVGATLYVVAIAKGWSQNLSFRGERILAWLDLEAYADTKGFQTIQSLYGIGSGGIWGKGIGKSMQKLGFLPEAQNDMIFSVVCEELGAIGGIAIMFMYLMLLWRIRDAAKLTKDPFGALLVSGVFAHIAIQVVLNIAVATSVIPNTGVSLPFISYGGSSAIFLLAEIGIVMNVGRNAFKNVQTIETDDAGAGKTNSNELNDTTGGNSTDENAGR